MTGWYNCDKRAPLFGQRACTLGSALCIMLLGCANDVVLGEHVTTTSGTTNATEAVTQLSDTHESSTNTPAPSSSFQDDGGPHRRDDRDNEQRGDEDRFPDSGFDPRLLDGGLWPPLPPGPHPMDDQNPYDPHPSNSGELRSDSAPNDSTSR